MATRRASRILGQGLVVGLDGRTSCGTHGEAATDPDPRDAAGRATGTAANRGCSGGAGIT